MGGTIPWAEVLDWLRRRNEPMASINLSLCFLTIDTGVQISHAPATMTPPRMNHTLKHWSSINHFVKFFSQVFCSRYLSGITHWKWVYIVFFIIVSWIISNIFHYKNWLQLGKIHSSIFVDKYLQWSSI